ncbi:MAG: CHAT domain-containing protein [Bacteroidales bacterium]|nr:CHAT domain-containing protein [Bacteroidales bacterium]
MKKLFILFTVIFISTAIFAQDDLAKATENFNLAKQYTAHNNFDKAIECYNTSSTLFKKAGQIPNYVISELSLSELLINVGRIKEAGEKLTNIESDGITSFGEKSKVIAHLYSLQGRIAFMSSDITTAKIKMNKALDIKIELFGAESVEAAMNMNDLALVYAQTGQVDSAIYYYEKNISIIIANQGEESPLLPTAYINLSNLYITLGKYDEAIEMKNKVIDIVYQTQGEFSPEIGEAYSGLGNAYISKGEYKSAEDFLLKSNDIFTQLYGKDNYKIATNYINLGNIYSNTGNYDFALQYYFLATKILENNFAENPELPSLYNNIGLVCRKQGNYPNAEIFFNKALESKIKSTGELNHQVAIIYSNLGSVNRAKNDTAQAVLNFRKSIDIMTTLYGKHNPSIVNPLLNVANIFFEQSKIDTALIFFQKSLIANSKSFDNENIEVNPPLTDYYDGIKLLEALNGKAKVYMFLYSEDSLNLYLDKALNNILLCDTLITQLRKSVYSKEDKIRLNGEISNVFDNAMEIGYMIKLANYKPNIDELMFYFIERNKTSTLLQAIADAKAENFSDVPENLVDEEKFIKQNINSYSQKIAEAETARESNFYRELLLEQNQRYQEIVEIYKNEYPSYYNAKFNVSLSNTKDIQETLDANTAMINYYVSNDYIFAYIITNNETQLIMSEFSDDEIYNIEEFNDVILSYLEDDIKKYETLAYQIYEHLFFFKLPSRITRLIIIPDKILGTLSFDALFYEKYNGAVKDYINYPFLVKNYNISYSYSATLFNETSKIDYSKTDREDIFALAPVFKPDNPQVFNDNAISTIMGTETEIQNLEKEFEDHKFTFESLMNQQANEYLVKRALNLKSYKILHIATHGFVNFENPELSALILSNDQQQIEDGILYSGEIYNLSLKTDLITLSACETARGKFSKGEGVIGLSRAFIYAGTKNLIISLWKVADIPTTELMTLFYKHLLDDNKKLQGDILYGDALHKAKLDMINGRYSHPFFWSSFILIGQ